MKTITKGLIVAMLIVSATTFAADESRSDTAKNEETLISWSTTVHAGDIAPEFTLKGVPGKDRSLSDFPDQVIVLEWVDFSCPESEALYRAGVIQEMQEKYREKGVLWFSINSSKKDQPGWMANSKLRQKLAEVGSQAADYLIDEDQVAAQAYGVSVSPTVILISAEGVVLYSGSPVEADSNDPYMIRSATNYLQLALDAALKKKEVPFTSN